MKKTLLLGVAAAIAASASAFIPEVSRVASVPVKDISMQKTERLVSSETVATSVRRQIVSAPGGFSAKRLVSPKNNPLIVNPDIRRSARKADDASGYVLHEDFEGADGTAEWIPEGWTTISGPDSSRGELWGSGDPTASWIEGGDGYAAMINYCPEYLDEWLVTPEVALGEGMTLSFDILDDPIWYFALDSDHVDWDAMEFVNQEVVFDQQVWITTDGGDSWTMLKSFAEDYIGMDLNTLQMMSVYTMDHVRIDLSAYAGEDVKIGFRYVGTDGQTAALDNVTIGLAPTELSYMLPLGSMFYGMSRGSSMLNFSIYGVPVFQPVTWSNMSWNPGATYEWEYFGADNEWYTSYDQDGLTVTYATDYTSDFTTRNNLYYPPVLKGESPSTSPAELARCDYFQAGGKASFELTDTETGAKEIEDFGFGVIDVPQEGFCTVSDMLVPIFGYDANSDEYWTDYTFQGDDGEGDWVKLTGYMNFVYAPESPVVIDGVWATGVGKIDTAATFKAEIIPLNDEFVVTEPIATAYCTGEDFSIMDTGGSSDFITANFKFDEPVVMSWDVCTMYVVRISGFNDPENVQYFNPLMSENDTADEMAYGWVSKTISFMGEERDSFSAVANYTGAYQAFYIMLDAAYPWLEADEDEVEVTSGSEATATLNSWYAGEELTLEGLPEWLTASATGRYGETIVTFAAADGAEGQAVVTVSAPGVSRQLTVNAKISGVGQVAAAAAADQTFTLQGVRVSDSAAPGLYIVKGADGKVRKEIRF